MDVKFILKFIQTHVDDAIIIYKKKKKGLYMTWKYMETTIGFKSSFFLKLHDQQFFGS